MSFHGRVTRGMTIALRECLDRASARRSRNRSEEVPRGVSRKTRQQMVRIRMTKRLAAGRKVRCLKHQPSEEETGNNRGWQRIKRRVRWRRKHAADEEASEGASINSDAAVAMKVKRRWLLGVFHRPVANDVVLIPTSQTCVICMENFKPGEILEVLPCQHIYHVRCIDRWLGEHKWCCVCKADVEEMAKAIRQRPRHRNSRSRSDSANSRSERLDRARVRPGYAARRARSTPSMTPPTRPAVVAARSRATPRATPLASRLVSSDRQTIPPANTRPYRPRAAGTPARNRTAINSLSSTPSPDDDSNEAEVQGIVHVGSSGVGVGVGMGIRRSRAGRVPSSTIASTPPLIVSHMSVCASEPSLTSCGERRGRNCSNGSSSDSIGISSSSSSSGGGGGGGGGRSRSILSVDNRNDGQNEIENDSRSVPNRRPEDVGNTRSVSLSAEGTQPASVEDSPQPSRRASHNSSSHRSKPFAKVVRLPRIFSGKPLVPARVQPHGSQAVAPAAAGSPSSTSQQGDVQLSFGRPASLTRVRTRTFWSRSSPTNAVSPPTSQQTGIHREEDSAMESLPEPENVRDGATAVRHLAPAVATLSSLHVPRLDDELLTPWRGGRLSTAAGPSRRHQDSPARGASMRIPSPSSNNTSGVRGNDIMSNERGGDLHQDDQGTGIILSARARVCAKSTLPTTAQLTLRRLPSGRLNDSVRLDNPKPSRNEVDDGSRHNSEPDSESASCATQWSETVSHSSGVSMSVSVSARCYEGQEEGNVMNGFPSRVQAVSSQTTSPEPAQDTTSRANMPRWNVEGPRSRSRTARSIWDDHDHDDDEAPELG